MPPTIPSDIADALVGASRVLTEIAVRALTASSAEITLPQFRALVVLADHGPQTLGSLAAVLDATPSSASRLCDRLVAKDLISRTEAPESRRQVRLALTPHGASVHAEVMDARRRELDAAVTALPPHLRVAMLDSLRAFVAAADGNGTAAPAVRRQA